MNDLVFAATLIAALGCGVVGGVFFAFSTFVMRALERLPAAQGIAAMQSINVVVINPWFMSAFMGTAALCGVLAVVGIVDWGERAALFRLIGAALYLVGSLGVTAAFNVPRNDALAAVDPASAEGAARWASYVPEWTTWNGVRTVASLLAAAALIAALVFAERAEAAG